MDNLSIILIKKLPSWIVFWSFRKIFGRRDVVIFEKMLEIPKWKKVCFEDSQKWIFEKDNSFSIGISGKSRNFKEQWTARFPDPTAYMVEVCLYINKELINKPLLFVGVDGWRNFVPLPKTSSANGKRYPYWDTNSLEYKVFSRIGFLDPLYVDLRGFGERCDVLVTKK